MITASIMQYVNNIPSIITNIGIIAWIGSDFIYHIISLICNYIGFVNIEYACESASTLHTLLKKIELDAYVGRYIYSRGKMKPSGIIIARDYFGKIEHDKYGGNQALFSLWGRRNVLMSLMDTEVVCSTTVPAAAESSAAEDTTADCGAIKPVNSTIPIYVRTCENKGIYYSNITYNSTYLEPIGDQTNILDSIVSTAESMNGRCTVFLSGPTGVGKSVVGLLVAKRLGAAYCHTFNPSDQGDMLANLVSFHRGNADDKKLVIVLEEADRLIHAIHTGSIVTKKPYMLEVRNKATFNTFLDDMYMYNDVILIMTSNAGAEEIDALDPSYLRKGRVNLRARLTPCAR